MYFCKNLTKLLKNFFIMHFATFLKVREKFGGGSNPVSPLLYMALLLCKVKIQPSGKILES